MEALQGGRPSWGFEPEAGICVRVGIWGCKLERLELRLEVRAGNPSQELRSRFLGAVEILSQRSVPILGSGSRVQVGVGWEEGIEVVATEIVEMEVDDSGQGFQCGQ